MDKIDIHYGGCTAQPNDYLSPDGDLDAALDLVPENGALKPFVQPASAGALTLEDTQRLYVHQTAEYTHYLVAGTADGVTLSWAATLDDTSPAEIASFEGQTFVSLVCIGNTVVMSTSSQLAYFIWRAEEETYVYLGDRVPDPGIQFALKSHLTVKDYEDTAVETTSDTSAETTGDGEWTDIERVLVSNSTSGDGLLTVTVTFPSDVTLVTGVTYRVYLEAVSGLFYMATYVYGTPSAGGDETRIAYASAGGTASFSVSEEMTGIWVKLTGNMRIFSGNVVLQQGSSAVYGRTVVYSEESYNAVLGCVNKFVQNEAEDKGRFIHPFFARYAVRLYDGSYSYVSPPALLLPNTGCAPFLFFYVGDDSGDMRAAAFVSDLQFKVTDEVGEEWEDVVDGVDIFVSQPIYPYDQGREYDGSEALLSYLMYVTDSSGDLVNTVEGSDYTLATVFYSQTDVSAQIEDDCGSAVAGHRKRDLFLCLQKYLNYFSTETDDGVWNIVQAARYDDDEMERKYRSVSAFYRIKSMTLADMADDSNETDDEGFVTLELADGILDSLAAQTALDEGTVALTAVSGAGLHVYNGRLHVYNASTRYEGPQTPVMLNGYTTPADDSEDEETWQFLRYSEAWVYIKTSQGERCANAEISDTGCYRPGSFLWYFYPNTRAYKLVLHWTYYYYITTSLQGYYDVYQAIPLTMHDYLNGAYALVTPSGSSSLFHSGSYGSSLPSSDVPSDTLLRASTIYVSEPSNPFAFTAASAVSVGAERVYALAAAARALSQGQFGQFPLYAFTSEGVWALETSDTGVYVARQPITRDVCTNTDSITQLDSSVLFVTEKGVMELAGSQSQCISETIDNHNENTVIASLQGIDTLLGLVGLETATMTVQPFREYIRECGMVYDSSNARVFIFNTDYPYTYVIDLKSMRWSFVSTLIRAATNSYPEALAVLQDGSVVNFSEETETDYVACALLTRPVKFGSPDTLKTVRTVIQRGMFPLSIRSTEETPDNPPVRQALYASRDLLNWHLVASSRNHIIRGIGGSGYKCFRLAAVFWLQPADCTAGFSAEVAQRQGNTIR